MSKESAIQFLEKVRENESILPSLNNQETSRDKEGMAKQFAEIAAEMGEDISAEDFKEALEEIEAEVRQRTENAVSDMKVLEDDDVEEVAGGGFLDKLLCEDLFFVKPSKKRKNCGSGTVTFFTD